MIKKILTYYEHHPLKSILLAGLFFRLLAVIFSKGFGWIDDQFLIIEIAQSWVDGVDYYGWLPDKAGINEPKGFSFFYVGLHYLLFSFLDFLQVTDAQVKMYVVRLIHAAWSLLIISTGYKIAKTLDGEKSARITAWLLAIFWLFPFLSVRNLVEYVSIPLLMIGIYHIVSINTKSTLWSWVWIGILFGIAFNIRYQTLLFTGSVGLVLLMQKKWKETLLVASGMILTVITLQGIVDYVIWEKAFVQLIGYIDYNIHHATEYLTAPWYFYILVILGLLIPPVSIYMAFGFFKSWKKVFIIFFPTLLYLIFHSLFPNKQERFIITIIPFFIIGGVIGWHQITQQLDKKPRLKLYYRASLIFFLLVNFLLLIPISTSYSKKARVEAMVYLSRYNDLTYFLIDDVNKSILRPPPVFYLENWASYMPLMAHDDLDQFKKDKKWQNPLKQPGFVLFMEKTNIEKRVAFMTSVFPGLEYETLIEPGSMDRFLHWLNPINDNQNIYIYRNNEVFPNKLTDE